MNLLSQKTQIATHTYSVSIPLLFDISLRCLSFAQIMSSHWSVTRASAANYKIYSIHSIPISIKALNLYCLISNIYLLMKLKMMLFKIMSEFHAMEVYIQINFSLINLMILRENYHFLLLTFSLNYVFIFKMSHQNLVNPILVE